MPLTPAASHSPSQVAGGSQCLPTGWLCWPLLPAGGRSAQEEAARWTSLRAWTARAVRVWGRAQRDQHTQQDTTKSRKRVSAETGASAVPSGEWQLTEQTPRDQVPVRASKKVPRYQRKKTSTRGCVLTTEAPHPHTLSGKL